MSCIGANSGNVAQGRELEASGFQTVDDEAGRIDGVEAVRLAVLVVPVVNCNDLARHGDYRIALHSGQVLPLSRRYREALTEKLGIQGPLS
jgi:hypothetical protein